MLNCSPTGIARISFRYSSTDNYLERQNVPVMFVFHDISSETCQSGGFPKLHRR